VPLRYYSLTHSLSGMCGLKGQWVNRRNSLRDRGEDSSSTDSDSEARRGSRRQPRFADGHPDGRGDGDHSVATEYHDFSTPSRTDHRGAADDQPLPAMYFEPTFGHEYFPPVSEPPTWGGPGYGVMHNRGVQNVPSMATIGVQYATDQTGTAFPTGTVPAGFGVPSFYQSTDAQHATDIVGQVSGLPVGSRTRVPSSSGGQSFYQPILSADVQTGQESELPVGSRTSVPSGAGRPSFYQPILSADVQSGQKSGLPVGSRIQELSRSGGPSFYHPSLPHGPQPAVVTGRAAAPTVPVAGGVVAGRPVVVSGSSCPLCGRQDHHAHSHAVVVNSSNSAAPADVASGRIVPQVALTPGQTTFLTRLKHFFCVMLFCLLTFFDCRFVERAHVSVVTHCTLTVRD